MKVISLWQPWASLVVGGFKKYETRGWETEFRGRLAIHAAKKWTGPQRALLDQPYFDDCLTQMGYFPAMPRESGLPFGAIVGEVTLESIEPTWKVSGIITDMERGFGDYSVNRFAWELINPVRYEKPIPIKGRQGFWNWEPNDA